MLVSVIYLATLTSDKVSSITVSLCHSGSEQLSSLLSLSNSFPVILFLLSGSRLFVDFFSYPLLWCLLLSPLHFCSTEGLWILLSPHSVSPLPSCTRLSCLPLPGYHPTSSAGSPDSLYCCCIVEAPGDPTSYLCSQLSSVSVCILFVCLLLQLEQVLTKHCHEERGGNLPVHPLFIQQRHETAKYWKK